MPIQRNPGKSLLLMAEAMGSAHRKQLESFVPVEPDDVAALRALGMASSAAELGTYGVGAVLMDSQGHIVCEGHNEVHVGGFRSDLHAEMVLLNKWEEAHPECSGLGGYTLVSSLEPCPMCMTRIIFAGVGNIRYVCPDDIGGMVQRKDALPPIFQELTMKLGQQWRLAECSEALRNLAFEIWDESREVADARVVERSCSHPVRCDQGAPQDQGEKLSSEQ